MYNGCIEQLMDGEHDLNRSFSDDTALFVVILECFTVVFRELSQWQNEVLLQR